MSPTFGVVPIVAGSNAPCSRQCVHRLGIHRRIRVIGDHELGVLLLTLSVPHLPGGADRGRHRRIDDHVAGHVQVADAAIGIDHRQRRASRIRAIDRRLHGAALFVGQRVDRLQQRRQAVVRIDAQRFQQLAVLIESIREVRAHGVSEDDRVRDPHHRRLQVYGEQDAPLPRVGELLGEEGIEGGAAHHRGIQHLARQDRDRLLQYRRGAVLGDVLDPHRPFLLYRHRLLRGAEIPVAHCRDVRAGARRPRSHRMRVVAGVKLHRRRRTAIGVALTQHRVHRAALDLVITSANVPLLVVRRVSG